MYGSQIGKKFAPDGFALRYPGNTVIADIHPGCGAYDVMTRLKAIAAEEGLAQCMILLPENSYHMTVIRGLNDMARADAYWPKALDRSLPFERADDYVEEAIARAVLPGEIRMRFLRARLNEEDFRVLVEPADEAQERTLRAFRDRAARQLSLRLPGHDEYGFHITLAYTLTVPESETRRRAQNAIEKMNALLAKAPSFVTEPPYVAFYDDMLRFSAQRIARHAVKGVNEG